MPDKIPPVDDEHDDAEDADKQKPSDSTDPQNKKKQDKQRAGNDHTHRNPADAEPRLDISFNLGGLLGNLAGLSGLADLSGATGNLEQIDENLRSVFERLSKLAQDAEEGFDINQELRDEDGNVRGHFGMSIHPLNSAPGHRRPPSSMPGRAPQRPPSRPPGGSPKSNARPATFEINRNSNELVVTVELPGVPYQEIEVALADSTLSVWTTGKRAYRADIRLPSTPADVISETLKDGILEVRLR